MVFSHLPAVSLTECWQKELAEEPTSQCVLHDIDHDGAPEILYLTGNQLNVLDFHGRPRQTVRFGTARLEWEKVWATSAPVPILPDVCPGDVNSDGREEIVCGLPDGRVVVCDAAGSTLWDFRTGGRILSTPAVYDINQDGVTEVIVGSTDGGLYILRDGEQLERVAVGGEITTPLYAGILQGRPTVLFGADDNCLHCYQGGLLWSYKTGGMITARPRVTRMYGQEVVVVGSHDGHVHIVDAEGHALHRHEQPGIVASAVDEHRIHEHRILAATSLSAKNSVNLFTSEGKHIPFSAAPAAYASPRFHSMHGHSYLVFGALDGLYLLQLDGNRLQEVDNAYLKYTTGGRVLMEPRVTRLGGTSYILFATDFSRLHLLACRSR